MMERGFKIMSKASLELVAKIALDDDVAWEGFVEKYTDWVLYKAKKWCVAHCPYSEGQCFCGLTHISMQRKGKTIKTDLPECDEGLDTYIWVFEQLRRRIKTYSGKNECLLSTFVWTILNSHELYVDWLRWKYGRVF
jgi:hypothetical protein